MDKVVVYSYLGEMYVLTPVLSCGLTLEEIIAKDIPKGAEVIVVARSELPSFTFQGAWVISEGVSVDLVKARSVAHDERRIMREAEMAPWDNIIAKQIPQKKGDPIPEIERQKIREKYAVMQNMIDSSVTVDDLEAALLFDEISNVDPGSTMS